MKQLFLICAIILLGLVMIPQSQAKIDLSGFNYISKYTLMSLGTPIAGKSGLLLLSFDNDWIPDTCTGSYIDSSQDPYLTAAAMAAFLHHKKVMVVVDTEQTAGAACRIFQIDSSFE